MSLQGKVPQMENKTQRKIKLQIECKAGAIPVLDQTMLEAALIG